jgi:hypothetical protein
MKHGQGTSVWPSGNIYTGAWVQDQRQGQGSMHWKTRGQHYTGHWVQGLPDGFGEHTWEQQRHAAGVPGSNHAMHVMHNRWAGPRSTAADGSCVLAGDLSAQVSGQPHQQLHLAARLPVRP